MNPFDGGGPRKRSRPNLYELLPTLYRRRDDEIYSVDRDVLAAMNLQNVGSEVADTRIPPLKALFSILQTQYDLLEAEIAALYDDWFVETCAPEMLPLLAEPLAIRDLDALRKNGADLRAVVANVVDYRRRKGTATALEEFARDATGWTVRVTDGVDAVAATARVDGNSLWRTGYADVRNRPPGGPDAAARSMAADLRSAVGGTRIATVEVWRVKAAPVSGVEPGRPDPASRRRRTFSPLGDDKMLMRPIDGTGDGPSYATPLTRTAAREDLAARGSIVGITVRELGWLGETLPPLVVADLSEWRLPAGAAGDSRTVYVDPEMGRLMPPDDRAIYSVDYYLVTHEGIGAGPPSKPWPGAFARTILVAPPNALSGQGRLRRLEGQLLTRVLMEPSYFARYRDALDPLNFETFGGEWAYLHDVYAREGGLPSVRVFLDRWPSFPLTPNAVPVGWLIDELAVLRRASRDADAAETGSFERVSSLSAALAAAEAASGAVRIVLGTSQTQSAVDGWRFRPGKWLDALSIESAPGTRPTLAGSLFLEPTAKPIPIRLLGLNIRGRIVSGHDAELEIEASTLRPVKDERGTWSLEGVVQAEPPSRTRSIVVRRSYLGGARLTDAVELIVEDSVVTDPIMSLTAGSAGPFLTTSRSTFLGTVEAYQLVASDALFDQPINVQVQQRGYLRYCAFRSSDALPQRYKCQLTNRQLLVSTEYGRPGFGRMRSDAPRAITTGSSDGSEIGAYGPYRDGGRRANLDIVLQEYVPEGVTPRVVYRS